MECHYHNGAYCIMYVINSNINKRQVLWQLIYVLNYTYLVPCIYTGFLTAQYCLIMYKLIIYDMDRYISFLIFGKKKNGNKNILLLVC